MPNNRRPEPVVLEIIERRVPGQKGGAMDVSLVPNEVRINGVPLWTTDDGIEINDMTTKADSLVTATITLICRRIVVDAEYINE